MRILIQEFTNYSFLALPILGVLFLYKCILIWFGFSRSCTHPWITGLYIFWSKWAPSSSSMWRMWNQSTWTTGTERKGWSLSCWPQKEYGFNYLVPCFSNSITGSTSSLFNKSFKCWQRWECPFPHVVISPCSGECPFPHAVESVHFPMQWFPHSVESAHFPTQWRVPISPRSDFPTQWTVPISPRSGEWLHLPALHPLPLITVWLCFSSDTDSPSFQ